MSNALMDPQRFGGIARLFGSEAASRLQASHIAVIGVGGVGSWAIEALARTGVGRLTMVDLDDVCITNTNRQLPALTEEIGRPKIAVLAERIRAINPECEVNALAQFFTPNSAETILSSGFDCVIDAIDAVSNKCLLLAECRKRGIPVVTTGAAGGKTEPCRVRVADLSQTDGDKLLRYIRKKLRFRYGFPREGKGPFDIPCVFSDEPALLPWEQGECAAPAPGESTRLDCAGGLGAATFVTGTFGFAAAREAVRLVLR